MYFKLSKDELNLIKELYEGFTNILIYKTVNSPSYVSFVLNNGSIVTLGVRDEYIADKFEVFPICIKNIIFKEKPEINIDDFGEIKNIFILQKSEWSISSIDNENIQYVGNIANATTSYEGREQDIPNEAINHVSLHAGLAIENTEGSVFLVASSMFPFALRVSNCNFSEPIDKSIYDFLPLEKILNGRAR